MSSDRILEVTELHPLFFLSPPPPTPAICLDGGERTLG